MSTIRLLLLAALVATGLLGQPARADSTTPETVVGAVVQTLPTHLVTLCEGDEQNYITVVDLPGSLVRIWARTQNGTMAFAGSGVVSPLGFVTIAVPKAAKIGDLPRYFVLTTSGEKADGRDWLE